MISTTTCLYFNSGVPGDLASSTCVTTSDVLTLGGFTYGELMLGFFFFALITMVFFSGIMNKFQGVRLKKSPWNRVKILKELDDQKQDDDA